MKRLAVFGASGHGKVIADMAENCGWDEVVFFDDAWPGLASNGHWTVAGDSKTLNQVIGSFTGVIVAIGSNAIRSTKLRWLSQIAAPIVTLVHPAASVSQHAVLGAGVVVMPNAVVNAYSTIGDGAILNTGCVVEHDCVVGACGHISPGVHLAGGVQVGDHSSIGIGASVKQLIKIGRGVTVGAGAAVVNDLPDEVTAVGVPARLIQPS